METIHNWLKGFTDVTEEELEFINSITETTTFKTHQVLLQQGKVSSKIGLLVKGATRTYYTTPQGEEKTIGFFFEGQPLVVVDSFLHKIPSNLSSATIAPSTIVWTDHERFTRFLHRFPKYNAVFVAAIAKWFSENKNRMAYQHQSTAKEKYEMLCKTEPQIVECVPLKYVASYLGITQETLSRIRAKKG